MYDKRMWNTSIIEAFYTNLGLNRFSLNIDFKQSKTFLFCFLIDKFLHYVILWYK